MRFLKKTSTNRLLSRDSLPRSPLTSALPLWLVTLATATNATDGSKRIYRYSRFVIVIYDSILNEFTINYKRLNGIIQIISRDSRVQGGIMNNQDIVERIKKVRLERGYTQQDLADFVNKTGSNISEIERGKVQVNAADLQAFAKALGKPIEYFFGHESNDPLIDDIVELLRAETPEARKNTLSSIKLALAMKHRIDRLQLEEAEPVEEDILAFLHDFIAYSKELDRQNEEVKNIRKLLLEELKKQGLDLLGSETYD